MAITLARVKEDIPELNWEKHGKERVFLAGLWMQSVICVIDDSDMASVVVFNDNDDFKFHNEISYLENLSAIKSMISDTLKKMKVWTLEDKRQEIQKEAFL